MANPTDVVKVRLQADGRLRSLGQAPRYLGTMHAFSSIAREEGVNAFWRGCLPNVQRATVVNGAGIAAYDHSKQTAIAVLGEGDSLSARFLAALTGGVITSLVGCPFDVIKTRLMNQGGFGAGQQKAELYSGFLECAWSIVRVEGIFALWKGLLPVYCRQAPFNLLNYLILEQLTTLVLGQSSY